jgi:3-hydroxyisobutyrate dehydrogenase
MRIAVIGIGRIGLGVARLARGAGHSVIGYDVHDFAPGELPTGLELADSPAAAANHADCVLIAVFNDVQLAEVMGGPGGITSAESPAPVVAILSTVAPEAIRQAHDTGRAVGIAVLDCGVSGGTALAHGEKLALAVGGDFSAFALVERALDAFGDPVVYMGPLGSGMAAKLARNVIHFCTAFVDWEASRLAVEAGVDLASFVQFVKGSETKVQGHMAYVDTDAGDGDLSPSPRLARFASKDLEAALELAEELNLTLPVASLAHERFRSIR